MTRFDMPIIKHNPENYIGFLFYVTRKWTKQWPTKETDEFQDGYIGLHYACNNYRGTTSFLTYTKGIIATHIRRGRNRLWGQRGQPKTVCREYFDPAVVNCPVELLSRRELSQSIADAISTLREPAQTYLREHHILGYSQLEVAERYGTTENAINHTVRRYRRRIARLLERFRGDYQVADQFNKHKGGDLVATVRS